MKIEKVNTWLTFIGHLAILLGLVALAWEIRHNTAAVRAQELGDLQNQTQERRVLLLTSDLPETYLKSLQTPDELSLEEVFIVNTFLNYRLDHLRRYYRAYQDGIINEADWNSELVNVPIYMDSKIGKLMWSQIEADFAGNPDFVAEVNRALAAGGLVPDDEFYKQLKEKISEID